MTVPLRLHPTGRRKISPKRIEVLLLEGEMETGQLKSSQGALNSLQTVAVVSQPGDQGEQ